MEYIDRCIEEISPLGGKIMAAVRDGHVCIRDDGDEGVCLNGDELFFEGAVGRWGEYVYLQKHWVLEQQIVKAFRNILNAQVSVRDPGGLEGLNEKQKCAVIASLAHSITCITGGPGTGKSYVIAEIIKHWGSNVCVCAPTGKAVGTLRNKLNVQIGTIHQILNISDTKQIYFGGDTLTCGMVIVDECSMIDLAMWAALLRNIPPGTRLVLVGDDDQLPPVEAGAVFGDLCAFMINHSKGYIRLTDYIRSENTEIIKQAAAAKDGRLINYQAIDHQWKRWKDKKFQLISCLRKGPCGVEAINEQLWDARYPIPIMITKRDRQFDLYNGDMGTLIKKTPGQLIGSEDVIVIGGEQIPASSVSGFEGAYCLSVHKSQGSEFDNVVLIVPPGSERFGREVLYTGITRAKKQLVVCSEQQVLEECLKKYQHRESGVLKKLVETESV